MTMLAVANEALSKIGCADVTAVDGTDTTPAGKHINRVLANLRQAELRAHPWRFATKQAALKQTAYERLNDADLTAAAWTETGTGATTVTEPATDEYRLTVDATGGTTQVTDAVTVDGSSDYHFSFEARLISGNPRDMTAAFAEVSAAEDWLSISLAGLTEDWEWYGGLGTCDDTDGSLYFKNSGTNGDEVVIEVRKVQLTKSVRQMEFIEGDGSNVMGDADSLLEEFDYEYDLPSDCIRVLKVVNQSDPEADDIAFRERGQVLFTDEEDAIIEYMFDEDDDANWDISFREAFTYRLAAELAMPLTGSMDMKRAVFLDYRMTLYRAMALDAGQQRRAYPLGQSIKDSRA